MAYKYKKIKLPNGKTMDEHRMIMEGHLGRKLSFNEVVHHKDNNPRNNSIENLEIIPRSIHSKHHWTEGDYKIDHRVSGKMGGLSTQIKLGKRIMITDKAGNDLMQVRCASIAAQVTGCGKSMVRQVAVGLKSSRSEYSFRHV